jgi:tetratricopeptide (TPR) repeat protein
MNAVFRRGCAAAVAAAVALIAGPVAAQSLNDFKCTGNPDTPWDEQIAGCTSAIDSGKFPDMGRAAALNNRGNAYQAKGDLDRAIADYGETIRIAPNLAQAFNGAAPTALR